MNCEDARALLPESWDGKLDEADELILKAHLERCAACTAESEELRGSLGSLGGIARGGAE